MRRSSVLVALVLLGSLAARGDVALDTPLPVDPALQMGRLPSGMAFWLRAHKTPPGKVALWLSINTGSLNEGEDERGLAHFIEHMAFNGTKNFPPGQVVKYFESIGLRFGHDQNASTSFDWTTYQIALPDNKAATIGKALTCFADFAFRQTLAPAQIDRERSVVLAEARARKGVQQRLMDRVLPLSFPGSRLADRMPIGKETILKTIGREAFAGYLGHFYRPDQATLLVVGDIDPAAVGKQIAAAFAGWPVAPPRPNAGPDIKPWRDARAAVITDPELPLGLVQVSTIKPRHPEVTVKDYRHGLVESMGPWLLDRRLDELVKAGKAPFQQASSSLDNLFNAATQAQINATGDTAAWRAVLSSVLTEVKRARDHGFSADELVDARRAYLASMEQRASTESTRDAAQFLSAMSGSLSEHERPRSAAQELELQRTLLPGVTAAEVNAAFRANFAPAGRFILLAGPQSKAFVIPTEQEILALAAKVEAIAVDPPRHEARLTRLMTSAPAPGTIVEQSEDPDLKILAVTFANGVRVHIRSMDYRKSAVSAAIVLGGGELRETAETRGLTDAAALAFDEPATAHLSSTQIRDYLTGIKVAVGGGNDGDALSVRLDGVPEQLEEGLQLAHLLLREGRVEGPRLERWKQETKHQLALRQTSVEARQGERVGTLLTGDDLRSRPLTVAAVDRISAPAAQAWLDQHLRGAPIEAAIVGDIPQARALELARKYLGSLPARPRVDPGLEKLRRTAAGPGPLEATVDVETITPRSAVEVGWRGPDYTNLRDRHLLQTAALILTSRLLAEVRQKQGLTYSIGCRLAAGEPLLGSGRFSAGMTVDPAKAARAVAVTRRVFAEFARRGPTAAELSTVRNQIKNDLEVQMKRPEFWRSLLEDLDYRRRPLEDIKTLLPTALAYTAEEIRDAVARYVREDRRFDVVARPRPPAKAAALSP
jgi:zinc protease